VPNLHRTHAGTVLLRATRTLGQRTRASAGGEVGSDWIRSSNLGDRSFHRASGFLEVQQRVADRLILYPGVRFDSYSQFGSALSPSLAARITFTPAFSVRASTGHAFRVPTFTELYYTDPNHRASSDLQPERGWSAEAGADWVVGGRAIVRATAFTRHDRDVIDWTRASAAERWQTMNVRRVTVSGVESGIRYVFGPTNLTEIQYTLLKTGADALTGRLSKYVLDYAPHNLVLSGAVRVLGIDVSPRLAWTTRHGRSGYAVVDLRASRRFRRITLFVEAANLFDEQYQEVVGAAMSGRWVSAGVRLAR
jgi:iron complex outermembrane receptor protein